MNMKTAKLMIFLAAMSIFSGLAFAGPPPRHPDGGPHRHHYHDRCGYRGSDGVRLAADIVGLVGVSLDILRGPAVTVQPVYNAPVYTVPAVQPVYTTPVYTTPVVQPVYTTPVYTVPAARPVYYRRPLCRPYYRY